jgi:hypothetical protein
VGQILHHDFVDIAGLALRSRRRGVVNYIAEVKFLQDLLFVSQIIGEKAFGPARLFHDGEQVTFCLHFLLGFFENPSCVKHFFEVKTLALAAL